MRFILIFVLLMGGVVANADDRLRQGVTVSCFRWGPGEWDGPLMGPTLDELKGLGVESIAVHPYAGIGNDGSVRYRPGPVTPATLTPLRLAHERGMATLLKPHLAYWGSGFSWRGDITFNHEADWQRFFDQYSAFILAQAKLAEEAGATVFCVGTELQGTMQHETAWREIIKQVRAVYQGKLTYAANWDQYRKVPFWDALDYVGVQAYFPLSASQDPTVAELEAGWDKVMAQVRAYSSEVDRPVLFTELGYAVSAEAAKVPWKDNRVGQGGEALKLRCMEVALRAAQAEPSVVGVFLWKWFPSEREISSEFVLQYEAMRGVIRGAWGG